MGREIEWINEYTALVTTTEALTEGDRITLQSRDITVNSLWKRFKIEIGRFFNPEYKYYNIHLEKDELEARIVDTADNSDTYVAEVTTRIKYYPSNRGAVYSKATEK